MHGLCGWSMGRAGHGRNILHGLRTRPLQGQHDGRHLVSGRFVSQPFLSSWFCSKLCPLGTAASGFKAGRCVACLPGVRLAAPFVTDCPLAEFLFRTHADVRQGNGLCWLLARVARLRCAHKLVQLSVGLPRGSSWHAAPCRRRHGFSLIAFCAGALERRSWSDRVRFLHCWQVLQADWRVGLPGMVGAHANG